MLKGKSVCPLPGPVSCQQISPFYPKKGVEFYGTDKLDPFLLLSFFFFFAFLKLFYYHYNYFWFIEKIAEVLKLDQEIHEIALKIHNQKSLLMMGRGYQFATCLEGALVCLFCVLRYFDFVVRYLDILFIFILALSFIYKPDFYVIIIFMHTFFVFFLPKIPT